MAFHTGGEVLVAIGPEPVPGTLSTELVWIRPNQVNFKRNIEKEKLAQALGVRDQYFDEQIIRDTGAGTIKYYLDSTTAGHLLKAIFGNVATTGAASVRTHAFTLADKTALTPSLSIIRKGPNYSEQFLGARIVNLVLEITSDNWVMATVEFISGTPTPYASAVGSLDSSSLFPNTEAQFAVASTINAAKAAANTRPKSLTITINQNTVGYTGIGAKDFSQIVSGRWSIMAEVVQLFKDSANRTAWIDSANKAAYLKLVGDRNAGAAAGAAKPELTIEIPNYKIESWNDSEELDTHSTNCLLYTSPSPRDS